MTLRVAKEFLRLLHCFDLIKAGATQTETSFLKQYVAGECVALLDDYDFPARTITETECVYHFDSPCSFKDIAR